MLKDRNQAFEDLMAYWVGSPSENAVIHLNRLAKVETVELSDGATEKRMGFSGCRFSLFIDNNGIVSGWRYIGDSKKCKVETCTAW